MQRRTVIKSVLAAAIAAATSLPVLAESVVPAERIVKALTTRPKAIQSKDGKWIQPDPTLDLQVQFNVDKADLTPVGLMQLDQLALAFQDPVLAQSRFEIAGHTDRSGSAEHNMKLSIDRANAVRDYLNQRYGVGLDRLLTQGYGFTRLADPVHPNAAVNRRVEIRHLMSVAYGLGTQMSPAQPVITQPIQVQPRVPVYTTPGSAPAPAPTPGTDYTLPSGNGQIVPRQ